MKFEDFLQIKKNDYLNDLNFTFYMQIQANRQKTVQPSEVAVLEKVFAEYVNSTGGNLYQHGELSYVGIIA